LASCETEEINFSKKIPIWSLLVGPQGSWALVHRTTCTTCMAATVIIVTADIAEQ